jgi:hypothetical protein
MVLDPKKPALDKPGPECENPMATHNEIVIHLFNIVIITVCITHLKSAILLNSFLFNPLIFKWEEKENRHFNGLV